MKRYIIPAVILVLAVIANAAVIILNRAANGTVEPITGGVRYTPNPSYYGPDNFVIGLNDRCLNVPLSVKQTTVTISGTFRDPNGQPMAIPDGLVMQIRGEANGQPYNYDAVYQNGQIVLIRPVAPTTAHQIVGYPPELIEGW